MDVWKFATAAGWLTAGTLGALASWAMARLGAELREGTDEAMRRLGAQVAPQPQGPDAEAWGMHLADEAAQLCEHGYDVQAADLYAVSGQLLEAADRARLG